MSMEKDSFQHQREGNVMAKVKSTYYSVDSLFQGQIDTSMISYKYKGQKMCTYDQSLSSGMKYACIQKIKGKRQCPKTYFKVI